MKRNAYEASVFSASRSQIFIFTRVCVLIPIILGDTAFAYWVFHGKVDPDEGYHLWPARRHLCGRSWLGSRFL